MQRCLICITEVCRIRLGDSQASKRGSATLNQSLGICGLLENGCWNRSQTSREPPIEFASSLVIKKKTGHLGVRKMTNCFDDAITKATLFSLYQIFLRVHLSGVKLHREWEFFTLQHSFLRSWRYSCITQIGFPLRASWIRASLSHWSLEQGDYIVVASLTCAAIVLTIRARNVNQQRTAHLWLWLASKRHRNVSMINWGGPCPICHLALGDVLLHHFQTAGSDQDCGAVQCFILILAGERGYWPHNGVNWAPD